jgi:hypothetical protein
MSGGNSEFNTWRRGEQGPRGPQGETGPRGAIGPAGPAGENDTGLVTAASGENIIGFRVVRIVDGEAFHCDNATLSHAGDAVGVALNSASTGDPVNIRSVGKLDELSWSWPDGYLYVGSNGALSATPGNGAFVQTVAKTLSATSIFITIGQEVITEG